MSALTLPSTVLREMLVSPPDSRVGVKHGLDTSHDLHFLSIFWSWKKVVKERLRPSLQVMLVTDLLNVSTDFAVVTLVSEDTLEDFTEVSLVIDDTKHSQKKVGTFLGGKFQKNTGETDAVAAVATDANAIADAVAFDVAADANSDAYTDADIDADSDAAAA